MAEEVLRFRVEVIPQTGNADVLEYARVPVKGDCVMFASAQWEVRDVMLWPGPKHVDATVWVTPLEYPRRTPGH